MYSGLEKPTSRVSDFQITEVRQEETRDSISGSRVRILAPVDPLTLRKSADEWTAICTLRAGVPHLQQRIQDRMRSVYLVVNENGVTTSGGRYRGLRRWARRSSWYATCRNKARNPRLVGHPILGRSYQHMNPE